MLKSFSKYMCSICKGDCEKGIVVCKCENMKIARCTDYIKDETKIKRHKNQEVYYEY